MLRLGETSVNGGLRGEASRVPAIITYLLLCSTELDGPISRVIDRAMRPRVIHHPSRIALSRHPPAIADERRPLTIFGEANQIEVVVVIGEDRFGFVAQAQEKVNVSRRPQHGAGVELMGVGGDAFDFLHKGFPHPAALVGGAHG
jgi:hypothetical protein